MSLLQQLSIASKRRGLGTDQILVKRREPYLGEESTVPVLPFYYPVEGGWQRFEGPALQVAMAIKNAERDSLTGRLLRALCGALVCGSVALILSLLLRGTSVATPMPVFFLLVIAGVVMIGGRAAGIAGSVTSALVFAWSMSEPLHSLSIRDADASAYVAWMLLFGIAISCFLAAPKHYSR
jgi:hypothetical protein